MRISGGGHTELILESPYRTLESEGDCVWKRFENFVGLSLLRKNDQFLIKNEVSDRQKSLKLPR